VESSRRRGRGSHSSAGDDASLLRYDVALIGKTYTDVLEQLTDSTFISEKTLK